MDEVAYAIVFFVIEDIHDINILSQIAPYKIEMWICAIYTEFI